MHIERRIGAVDDLQPVTLFLWLILVPALTQAAPGMQVVINGDKKQVEMWLVSKADTGEVAPGISIAAGERVLVEISRKFTVEQLQGLAYNAGLYMQVPLAFEMEIKR